MHINLDKYNYIKNPSKLILISGIPVIGIPNNVITELTAVNPRTVYHVTKVFQELLLNQLNLKNSTINVINLRIPSPIGPGQPVTSIVPVFLNQALKNDRTDFVYNFGQIEHNVNQDIYYLDTIEAPIPSTSKTTILWDNFEYNVLEDTG